MQPQHELSQTLSTSENNYSFWSNVNITTIFSPFWEVLLQMFSLRPNFGLSSEGEGSAINNTTQNFRPQTVTQVTYNTIIYHTTPTPYPAENKHLIGVRIIPRKGKPWKKPPCPLRLYNPSDWRPVKPAGKRRKSNHWTCWPQSSQPYYC